MTVPWFSLFLISFSAGTCLGAASLRTQDTGKGFHRLCLTVAFLLAVLGCLGSGVLNGAPAGPRLPLFAFALLLLVAAAGARLPRMPAWPFRPAEIALCLAGAVAAALVLPDGAPEGAVLALPVSAAVLGAALVAMLLGHSYLASRAPGFDLLVDSCSGLVILIVLRGLAAFALFWPDRDVLATWLDRDPALAILAAIRFLVGILGAGVLTWMALDCARIRSNQSATGILYVVLGFVIMGELVAAYMLAEKGIVL